MEQFFTPFDTNAKHRSEQVSRSYAEISEWSLTQRISAPGVLVHISVLEQSVHDAQCAVIGQLHQESSVIIDVSIIMSADHTPPSFPTCALKSPKTIGDSLNFFHQFWVQCTWVWAVCLYQSQGVACSFPPGGIHQSTQFSSWWLASTPMTAWANFAGSTPEQEFPPVVQLNSVRTTTLREMPHHSGIIVWLPRPVRVLFLWAKWRFSFQLLAYGEITVVYTWLSSLPEEIHSALSPFASPDV